MDPQAFDSRSLRPVVTGRPGEGDESRTLLIASNAGWPAVRRGALKLITRRNWVYYARALFDIDADPGETVNLIDDPRFEQDVVELNDWLESELGRPIADLPFIADEQPSRGDAAAATGVGR